MDWPPWQGQEVARLRELYGKPSVLHAAIDDQKDAFKAVSKFLKELSRNFGHDLHDPKPSALVRLCSQQHFLEVAFFSLFQKLCKTLTVSGLFFVVSSMVADMSVLRRGALEHLTPPKHWRSRAITY